MNQTRLLDLESVCPPAEGIHQSAQFLVTVPPLHDDFLIKSLAHAYPDASTRTLNLNGAAAIITEQGEARVRTYECADGSGCVVIKGLIHDRLTGAAADPKNVADAFMCATPAFNRFEGEFAAVIHDERRGITWAINDHASLLHLYYVERGGVFYITTAPLATARALGLGLSGAGVREFLGRGQVMCPNSLFADMRRLGLGEHLRLERHQLEVGRHWSPYNEPRRYSNKLQAAEKTAEVLTAMAGRYASRGPLVADLTGGYDSRLVTSALARAGAALTVTVNGHREHKDVVIARRVAEAAGWPILHYGDAFTGEMTADMWHAAAYMSRGELSGAQFYLHLVTRPAFNGRFAAHIQGGGGELLRNFPWGQEFAGIGRRQPANVERLLRYRLLTGSILPENLFVVSFRDRLWNDIRARAQALIDQGAGTLTTQQLDAVYLLRLTGHAGGYTSSLYDLCPTGVPLMHRAAIDHAVSLPWTMRVSAGLLRRTLRILCPQVAAVETIYGGTGAPPTLRTLPLEALQAVGRIRHFADKIDRVVLGARLSRLVPLVPNDPKGPEPPFRTQGFRTFLNPLNLFTRGLYDPKVLNGLLSDPVAPTESLSRLATLEHVCRELRTEPAPELLLQ